MSIRYKGQTIAGGYEMTSVGNATEQSTGLVRLATEEETKTGASNSLAVTPKGYANVRNSMITDCILDVPQRINLTLSNSVMTLAAGSEVIIPDGFEEDGITRKFIHYKVESPITLDVSAVSHTNPLIGVGCYNSNVPNIIEVFPISRIVSSDTMPTNTGFIYWYDTANNICYIVQNGSILRRTSFFIAQCTGGGSSVGLTSIDQVFNGIGYIGSTVWCDKDVKVLMPDGRNADGTLKNIERTTSSIITRTFASNTTGSFNLVLTSEQLVDILMDSALNYDENKNEYDLQGTYLGKINISNGTINTVPTLHTFQAVDRNDKQWLSSLGSISTKSIDLTLGAAGTVYTAPANGYFSINQTASSAALVISMEFKDASNNPVGGMSTMLVAAGNRCWLISPLIKKGNKVMVWYNTTDTAATIFKFIYAEAEV